MKQSIMEERVLSLIPTLASGFMRFGVSELVGDDWSHQLRGDIPHSLLLFANHELPNEPSDASTLKFIHLRYDFKESRYTIESMNLQHRIV
jgi:hypothetical protein